MFFFNKSKPVFESKLFDEKTFYFQFLKDIENAKSEIIIESPFITSSRMSILMPYLESALSKGVSIQIITRDPIEHDEIMRYQTTEEILECAEKGIEITLKKGYFHRKLAIIDRKVLWEGSLNILSQSNSQEIMRRIKDKAITNELFRFIKERS